MEGEPTQQTMAMEAALAAAAETLTPPQPIRTAAVEVPIEPDANALLEVAVAPATQ